MAVIEMVPADRVCLKLPAALTALEQGRRAVERHLSPGLPAPDLEAAKMVVTELLANSVRHANLSPDESIDLIVHRFDDLVRIEVQDSGPCFDCVREPSEAGGRGLMIVEKLSRRWGRMKSWKCRVWCELDVSRPSVV
ncbi:MAG TPA: ATP-binding protein [Actinomycetota bacterium]|nr:ATP-binding protein [Actinomycetota bacterium]